MSQEDVNIRHLLRESPAFGAEQVEQIKWAIAHRQAAEARQEVMALRNEVDAETSPKPQDLLKVGVCLYLLGRHAAADEYLSQIEDDPLSWYYHALVFAALERHDEAAEAFAEAAMLGFDSIECTLRRAGEVRLLGDLEEAESLIRSTAPAGAKRAEYSYQMGCVLADRGDTYGAIEYFERAVDMDPRHSRALFSLAVESALRGDDDAATVLYERSLSHPPIHLGALLNLGLQYEDQEAYGAAAYCYRRVLEFDPNHERAILYLKDIEATSHMFYDEESARQDARMEQLLARPVSDFELTVRSRNCLENIGIHTLGDLTHVTEQDLLGSKNFGETSLSEVRELMAANGLRVGQNVHKAVPIPGGYFPTDVSPEERAALERPISELNLSVRARKCMSRLGITQIGDLVRRTADELLGSKNFGVTSLNEVRAKLAELDLRLRNE